MYDNDDEFIIKALLRYKNLFNLKMPIYFPLKSLFACSTMRLAHQKKLQWPR